MASKISEADLKTVGKSQDGKSQVTSGNVEDDKFQDLIEEHTQKTRKQFEMVKSKSDEAYAILKQDFDFIESKRKNFTEMSKKLKDVHFNDIVKLNVGGEMFATSLETLKKFPNSLFANMFSGSTKLKQESDGAYFIDRDGSLFR